MILYQSEIDAGEIIVTDPLDANYNATDITSAWAKYSALNAIVPERILKPATGSRGDIEQTAIWEDGTWYTEITRKLVTGHDDDVQFDDLSKTYAFGIATMDNTGGGGHNTHGSTIYQLAFDIVSEPPTDEEAPPADEEKPGGSIPIKGWITPVALAVGAGIVGLAAHVITIY